MTDFENHYPNNNGDVNVGFETVNTNNFLVVGKIISKRVRALGGSTSSV